MKEALERIKEAEVKGEKRIAHAEQRAKEIIDGAAIDAEKLVKAAEAEARSKVKGLIEKAESLGHERGEALTAEGRKDIDSIKREANRNIEKAVDLVVERVSHD